MWKDPKRTARLRRAGPELDGAMAGTRIPPEAFRFGITAGRADEPTLRPFSVARRAQSSVVEAGGNVTLDETLPAGYSPANVATVTSSDASTTTTCPA